MTPNQFLIKKEAVRAVSAHAAHYQRTSSAQVHQQHPCSTHAARRRRPLSPTCRSRPALERSDKFRRDPAAIEAAGLRCDRCAADAALQARGVEGHAVGDGLGPGQRLRIAPGYAVEPPVLEHQRPVSRRAFPLAERAAACRHQQAPVDIGPGQVERRRVRCFEQANGIPSARNRDAVPRHDDFPSVGYQCRWTRKIPDRLLPWAWQFGEWRSLGASPPPVAASALQPVRRTAVAAHVENIATAAARWLIGAWRSPAPARWRQTPKCWSSHPLPSRGRCPRPCRSALRSCCDP